MLYVQDQETIGPRDIRIIRIDTKSYAWHSENASWKCIMIFHKIKCNNLGAFMAYLSTTILRIIQSVRYLVPPPAFPYHPLNESPPSNSGLAETLPG